MKPFYRVLTYLVVVIQSFVILLLLAEKQKDSCTYTAGSSMAGTGHKTVRDGRDYAAWHISACSPELLQFPSWYCKR